MYIVYQQIPNTKYFNLSNYTNFYKLSADYVMGGIPHAGSTTHIFFIKNMFLI